MLDFAPIPLLIAQTIIFLLAFGAVAALIADRVGGRLDFGSGALIGLAAGFLAVLWPQVAPVDAPLPVPAVLLGPVWSILLLAGVAGGVVGAVIAGGLAAGASHLSGGAMEITGLFAVVAFLGLAIELASKKVEPKPQLKQILSLGAIGTVALLAALWVPAPPDYPPQFDQIVPVVLSLTMNTLGCCAILGALLWLDRRRRVRAAALVAAKAAMDASADATLWLDTAGRIRYANAAASTLLGFTAEELNRRNLWDIEHNAGDPNASYKRLAVDQKPWPRFLEARYLAKSSEAISLEVTGTLVPLQSEQMICLVLRPPGGNRPTVASDAGAGMSGETWKGEVPSGMRDPLTGLGTIEGLARTGQSFAGRVASREIDNLAVAVVEIDNFKAFVDRRGLAMGDALLQSYARSLRQTLRQEDEAYRIGNQQFAVLLPGRGEGAFELLRIRFADVLSLTRRAGFPEASAAVGFSALSEVANDVGKAVDLAGERLRSGRAGFRRGRPETGKPEAANGDS